MPRLAKRRAPQRDPSESPESSSEEERAQPRRRRDEPEDDTMMDDAEGDAYGGDEGTAATNAIQPLARKLCRYALACEYSRQPIRRPDVVSKVLPAVGGGRSFKAVFEEAQGMLRGVFGMEMVELPGRERVTLKERRAAAAKADKKEQSTRTWVLQSTLPPKYKMPSLIPPPQVPTTEMESTYVGLYTFIISTIYLAGGTLPESKLDRYLRATNADRTTPVDKKDRLLQRMQKENYIVKIRDTTSGEEVVEYMVGPRGKVEVGEEGAASLVRSVFGSSEDTADLEKRIDRSLGISAQRQANEAG